MDCGSPTVDGHASHRTRIQRAVRLGLSGQRTARGGPHWQDGFRFSGSNNPDAVAWYGPRWTAARSFAARLLGPRLGWKVLGRRRFVRYGPTRTHDVATKAP